MRARKKGFTIVEVVIALAVLAVMSVAATSIILSSLNVQNSYRNDFFAENICRNSLTVFRSAASKEAASDSLGSIYDDFADKMKGMLDIEPIKIESSEIEPSEGETAFEITAEAFLSYDWENADKAQSKYRCVFKLAFDADESNKVNFIVQVIKIKNNSVISSSEGYVLR